MRFLQTWIRRLMTMFGRIPSRAARRRAARRAHYQERIHQKHVHYRRTRNRSIETLEARTVMSGDPVYDVAQNNTLTIDASAGVLAAQYDPGAMTQASLDPTNGTPQNGALTFNPDGSFSYTPNDGFSGSDSFEIDEQNDDGSTSEDHWVTINVASSSSDGSSGSSSNGDSGSSSGDSSNNDASSSSDGSDGSSPNGDSGSSSGDSSNNDANNDGNPSDQPTQAPPAQAPPVLNSLNIDITPASAILSGTVSSPNCGGCTVYFGGLLDGYSTQVNDDGTYSLTIADPSGLQGNVTATVIDSIGQPSNTLDSFFDAEDDNQSPTDPDPGNSDNGNSGDQGSNNGDSQPPANTNTPNVSLTADNTSITDQQTINFSGSVDCPDSCDTTWAVVDNSNGVTVASGSGASFSFSGSADSYTATLIAYDEASGNTGSASVSFSITPSDNGGDDGGSGDPGNSDPGNSVNTNTPNVSLTADNTSITDQQAVNFSGSVDCPDYCDTNWQISDSSNSSVVASGSGTNFSFSGGADSYTATLIAYDEASGNTGSASWSFSIVTSVTGTSDPTLTANEEDTSATAGQSQVIGLPISGGSGSYSISASPNYGSFADNGNGSITYTPNGDYSGTDSFAYYVTDADGQTASNTINISVASAVTGTSDPTLTANEEDTSATAGQSQVIGLPISGGSGSYSISASPGYGSFADNGNGSITYTPNGDYSGTDSFAYYVTDADGQSASNTINIDVASAAIPNVSLTADNTSITDQQAVNFSGSVDCPDTCDMTWAVVDNNTGVTVASGSGTNFSFSGSADSYTATLSAYDEASGNTGSASWSFSVMASNPGTSDPTLTADEEDTSATAGQSQVIGLPISGGSGSYSISASPNYGSFADNGNGSITYTPNGDYSGTDSFAYYVTDADGQSASNTININVASAAIPNVSLTADNTSITDQQSINFSGSVDCPDYCDTTWAVVDNNTGVTVASGSGTNFSFSGSADSYTATLSAYDEASGNTGSASWSFSITPSDTGGSDNGSSDPSGNPTNTNTPNVSLTADNTSITDQQSINFSGSVDCPDYCDTTWAVVDNNTGVTVASGSGTNFSFSGSADSYTATLSAYDEASGNTGSASWSFSITPSDNGGDDGGSNDPGNPPNTNTPNVSLTADNTSITDQQTVNFSGSVDCPDSCDMTWTVVGNNTGVTVASGSGASFSFSGSADSYTATFSAYDEASGNTGSASWSFSITPSDNGGDDGGSSDPGTPPNTNTPNVSLTADNTSITDQQTINFSGNVDCPDSYSASWVITDANNNQVASGIGTTFAYAGNLGTYNAALTVTDSASGNSSTSNCGFTIVVFTPDPNNGSDMGDEDNIIVQVGIGSNTGNLGVSVSNVNCGSFDGATWNLQYGYSSVSISPSGDFSYTLNSGGGDYYDFQSGNGTWMRVTFQYNGSTVGGSDNGGGDSGGGTDVTPPTFSVTGSGGTESSGAQAVFTFSASGGTPGATGTLNYVLIDPRGNATSQSIQMSASDAPQTISFGALAGGNSQADQTWTIQDTLGNTLATATAHVYQFVSAGPSISAEQARMVGNDGTIALNSMSVTDADVDTLQVHLTANHGTLAFSSPTGLNFVSGSNHSDTMTVSGSVEAINSALTAVVYTQTAGYTGPDTVAITASDLAGSIDRQLHTASATITVVPFVSVPPEVQSPVDVQLNENNSVAFGSEDNGISVSAVDSSTLAVTLQVAHGTLTLGSTAGLTFTSDDGVNDHAMMFSGAIGDLNTALGQLIYTPDHGFFGADELSITADDLGSSRDHVDRRMSAGVVLEVMATGLAINAPQNIALSGKSADSLGVSVQNDRTDQLTVQLAVVHGGLSLGTTAGLTFTQGTGIDDRALTFSGNITDLNTALAGLTYRADDDYTGSDDIAISVTEHGVDQPQSTQTVLALDSGSSNTWPGNGPDGGTSGSGDGRSSEQPVNPLPQGTLYFNAVLGSNSGNLLSNIVDPGHKVWIADVSLGFAGKALGGEWYFPYKWSTFIVNPDGSFVYNMYAGSGDYYDFTVEDDQGFVGSEKIWFGNIGGSNGGVQMLTDSNNDGTINGSDSPQDGQSFATQGPGRLLFVNAPDDGSEADGTSGTSNPPLDNLHLAEVDLAASLPYNPYGDQGTWSVTLSAYGSADTLVGLKLWADQDRTTPIGIGTTWPMGEVPAKIWVEAATPGTFQLYLTEDGSGINSRYSQYNNGGYAGYGSDPIDTLPYNFGGHYAFQYAAAVKMVAVGSQLHASLVSSDANGNNTFSGTLAHALNNTEGAFVPVNDNDDDYDGTPDDQETGTVTGEKDLLPITITGLAPVQAGDGYYSLAIPDNVKVWLSEEKSGGEITSTDRIDQAFVDGPVQRTADGSEIVLYVEGTAVGAGQITLKWNSNADGSSKSVDQLKVTTFDFVGPANVPGNSTYTYTVDGANGAWTGQVVGGTATTGLEPTTALAVNWGNDAIVGKASYDAAYDGLFVWEYDVNVVKLTVTNPALINPAQIIVERKIVTQDADGNLVPNPYEAIVIYYGVKTEDHGADFTATIDAKGPKVLVGDPANGRGVNQINVGFIQNVTSYSYASTYEGGLSLDDHFNNLAYPILDASADDNDSPPWYRGGLGAYVMTGGHEILSAADSPHMPVPFTYEIDVGAFPGTHILESISQSIDFTMYICASTLDEQLPDTQKTYTVLAKASWGVSANIDINDSLEPVLDPSSGIEKTSDWQLFPGGSPPVTTTPSFSDIAELLITDRFI